MASRQESGSRTEALTKFLSRCIAQSTDAEPILAFRVYEAIEGTEKQKSVLEIAFHERLTAEAAAESIFDHCESEARSLGEKRRYAVRAAYGHSKEGIRFATGRCLVTVDGTDGDEDEEDNVIGRVTGDTLLAQAYRHMEAERKTSAILVGELVEAVKSTAESALRETSEMRRAMGDMQRTMMDLHQSSMSALDQKTARELMVRTELRKQERIDQAVQIGLRYLGPIAADKIGTATSLEMLADNMDADEVAGVLGALKPERAGWFEKILLTRAAQLKAAKEGKDKLDAQVQSIAGSAPAIGVRAKEEAPAEPKKDSENPEASSNHSALQKIVEFLESLSWQHTKALVDSLEEWPDMQEELFSAFQGRDLEKLLGLVGKSEECHKRALLKSLSKWPEKQVAFMQALTS